MNDKKLRQILETKRAIKTILTLYEKKRMASNELAKIIGGSRSTPQKRFKEYIRLNVMKKEPIFDEKTDRVLVMYSLTEKGEEIARKLSYVIDSEKEVVAIDNGIANQLKKVYEKEGVATWETLIHKILQEWLKERYDFKTRVRED